MRLCKPITFLFIMNVAGGNFSSTRRQLALHGTCRSYLAVPGVGPEKGNEVPIAETIRRVAVDVDPCILLHGIVTRHAPDAATRDAFVTVLVDGDVPLVKACRYPAAGGANPSARDVLRRDLLEDLFRIWAFS